MAPEDAEIVRRAWEDFTRREHRGRDLRELAERWWHPEITYEEDPRWPGSGRHEGREAVTAVFEGYQDVLGQADASVVDIVDAGDAVVALIRFRGISPGADVPWDHVWAYLIRLHEGKLGFLRAYWDPDEALAAAGVDSP